MPELPEVEVTRRGLAPYLEGRAVGDVVLRRDGLRWPAVSTRTAAPFAREHHTHTARRGKYLLIEFDRGTLLVHLGMSGSLRMVPASAPAGKHDHFDLVVGDQAIAHDRPAPLRCRVVAQQ